jgi:hypothetical protein
MSCVLILPEASIGINTIGIFSLGAITASSDMCSTIAKQRSKVVSTRDINLRLVCVRINSLVLHKVICCVFKSGDALGSITNFKLAAVRPLHRHVDIVNCSFLNIVGVDSYGVLRYFIRVINSLKSANNAVPVVLCLVPPPSSDSDSPPPPELGFLFYLLS